RLSRRSPSERPRPIEPPQRRGPLARAASQAGRHRNALGERDPRPSFHAGGLAQKSRGANDQVALIGWQVGIVGVKRGGRRRLERQPVGQVHRQHHGGDLMISVGSLSEHLQSQVHLGRGPDRDATGASRRGHPPALGRTKRLPRTAAKCQRKSWILTVSGTVRLRSAGSNPVFIFGSRYRTTTSSLPSSVASVSPAGGASAGVWSKVTRAGVLPPVHSTCRA